MQIYLTECAALSGKGNVQCQRLSKSMYLLAEALLNLKRETLFRVGLGRLNLVIFSRNIVSDTF